MIEPHLWVSNVKQSVAWYSDVLGFEPAQWFPDEASATWCQLERGDVQLMVAIVPEADELAANQQYMSAVGPRAAGPGGAMSLYLHVDDATAAHEAAVAAGANIIEDLWDPWWGGRQFSVVDPDSNWWSVYQRLSD